MNPFKHKQLVEFTIEDCELYIRKYPYGEHALEVKRKLRELKTQNEAKSDAENSPQTQFKEEAKQINEDTDSSNNIDKDYDTDECDVDKEPPKDIAKNIFAWIGLIVVVLVIGAILSTIVPDHLWNKYRYIVYPAAGVLGRWLQKELNW